MPRFIVYGRMSTVGPRSILCSVDAATARDAVRIAAKRRPGTRNFGTVLYADATEQERHEVAAIDKDLEETEAYFDSLGDTGSAGKG